MPDAKIYSEVERIEYFNFWDSQISALNEKARGIKDLSGTGHVIEKINQFRDIRRIFDDISDMLRNMNTLSLQILNDTGYDALSDAIQEQINQEH
jgi:hypothetical protein